MKRKKLLIDVNPVVPYYINGNGRGITRTCLELVEALDKLDNLPFDLELYSQNMKGIGVHNMHTKFRGHHIYLPNRPMFNRLASTLALREIATSYDLMHITHNYEIIRCPEKCILTIHDAMFMRINDPTAGTDNLCTLIPPLAQKVRQIFTCSECSKRDIVETMGISPEKVSVVYWGIDHNIFHPIAKDLVRKQLDELFGIVRPYYFSVSCSPARKRVDKLVEAYIRAINSHEISAKIDLVLAWGNIPDYVRDIINNAGEAREHIKILGYVSDEQLALLYNGAKAMFFPSLYEGFGLPLIEAMACGTPVVTCRNSCLEEIAGDAGIYIDEPMEEKMCEILKGLETDGYDLNRCIARGKENSKKFNWQITAQKYVDVYTNLLK